MFSFVLWLQWLSPLSFPEQYDGNGSRLLLLTPSQAFQAFRAEFENARVDDGAVECLRRRGRWPA